MSNKKQTTGKSEVQTKTVKNRTTGKRIDINKVIAPNNVVQAELDKAIAFQETLVSRGKTDRPEYYNLAKVWYDAREGFGNTKDFGAWRSKIFPHIPASMGSELIRFYCHYDRINKWAEVNRPALNNPQALCRIYVNDTNEKAKKHAVDNNKPSYVKIKLVAKFDETGKGKIEKETVFLNAKNENQSDNADTTDKGIAGLTEDLRKSMNRVIKALDNYKGEHLIELVDLAYTFNAKVKESAKDHTPKLVELKTGTDNK